jgi:alpha-mannosidase
MAHRYLDHALEILSRLKARAFFALCAGQKKAESDAIPIMIYNPFPYPIEDDFFCEFNLWDQVRDPVFLQPTVYRDGIAIPTQCEKEGSSIPMQWRKRVVFHATLQPMTVNRFDCKFTVLPARPDRILAENNTHYIFDNAAEHIEINKATGWIDRYCKNGNEILSADSFRLDVFADDYDPWGMMIRGWDKKIGEFSLLSNMESAHFACLEKPLSSVHVIEDGDVRSVVEAFFGYGDSKAVINYTMSKTDGMQVTLRMHWNEKQKLVKMHIPAAFDIQQSIGDRAYGSEPLCNGIGEESCIQKYVAVLGSDYGFYLANSGTYGISYDNEHNIIYPTLIRSPSFCAHPFDDRTVVPQDRFCPYIDQGERIFRFDFMADTANAVTEKASRKAQIFNEGFMAISFYPAGTSKVPESGLCLSGSNAITLTAFKKAEICDGYILRFFNSVGSTESCSISGFGQTTELTLSPYEIRTLRLTENGFEDADLMEGLLG